MLGKAYLPNMCTSPCRPDHKRKKEGEQEMKAAEQEKVHDEKKAGDTSKDDQGKSNGAHHGKNEEQEDGEEKKDEEKAEDEQKNEDGEKDDEEKHAKKQKMVHHSVQPEHPGTHRKSVASVAKLHEENGIELPKSKERMALLKKLETLEDMKEVRTSLR